MDHVPELPEVELRSTDVPPQKYLIIHQDTVAIEIGGYSAAEVADLLTVYRDHLRLMGTMAVEMQNASQSEGFRPGSV